MPVIVSELAIAPVKGMRLQRSTEIRLGHHGVMGDREFLIVDEDGKLLSTSRNPGLLRVEPSWEPARNLLALRFPDGSIVQDAPEPGTAAVTRMYDGRELPGRVVPGPLSAALSGYLGRAVHLFKRAADYFGTDDRPVTLMSDASLQALAAEFSGTAPDPRRFRMNITVTGADPWAEHGWSEARVTIGDVALGVLAPVPRCVVTTRNPESGATDARILHALARLRGKDDITFGVWCETIQPGRIRVGDPVVAPEPSG
jgi:uncharacterized protein YcbX